MSWPEAVLRVVGWTLTILGGLSILLGVQVPDGKVGLAFILGGLAALVVGLIPVVKYHYDDKLRGKAK